MTSQELCADSVDAVRLGAPAARAAAPHLRLSERPGCVTAGPTPVPRAAPAATGAAPVGTWRGPQTLGGSGCLECGRLSGPQAVPPRSRARTPSSLRLVSRLGEIRRSVRGTRPHARPPRPRDASSQPRTPRSSAAGRSRLGQRPSVPAFGRPCRAAGERACPTGTAGGEAVLTVLPRKDARCGSLLPTTFCVQAQRPLGTGAAGATAVRSLPSVSCSAPPGARKAGVMGTRA